MTRRAAHNLVERIAGSEDKKITAKTSAANHHAGSLGGGRERENAIEEKE
ncbi:hypothetical protein RRSWK_02462 [Rhodopirellula sp. SWK7]|nr:hypothetical protein RRSWK_02462 [Rhodopirellula sp. SWK7]